LSVLWMQPLGMLLTVMMRVFDGGDGSTSGGRSERSMESGDLLRDDARERCGEGMVACMLEIMDAVHRDVVKVCCVSAVAVVSWRAML
jgi:hypothetical protein